MSNLFSYLIIINIITVVIYGADKLLAKLHGWRMPEVVLLALAASGGTVGAYLAMHIFRHKTLHWKFKLGVPLIFLIQAAVFIYLQF